MSASLILLLWACGVVMGLWLLSHHKDGEITIGDLIFQLIWPLAWSGACIAVIFNFKDRPIWRRKP